MPTARRWPSGGFLGTLAGIALSPLIPAPFMLTELGVVVYLLAGATLGAVAGTWLEWLVKGPRPS